MAAERSLDPATQALLDGLNPAQREAVQSPARPLCILAAAGSGKTRVLTRRIAYRVATGSAEASRVMAVTFTRRAAQELRGRLVTLGLRDSVAAGTFHSLALAQLRRRWADRGVAAPALVERKLSLLLHLLGPSRSLAGPELAAEVEWAQARMIPPDQYAAAAAQAGRRPCLPPDEVAELLAGYQQEKRRRRVIDFDDVLGLCAQAYQRDPAFAEVGRWRFRHLFVDEFQDLNPLQAQLLDAWRGDSLDLCVVGDPNQAIYSWNGADPANLARFMERFPAAGLVRLNRNYRSTPEILAVASSVLASGAPSWDRRHVRGPDLVADSSAGPRPTVSSYADEVAEARAVATALRRRAPSGWGAQAVLARTHNQLLVIERALRQAGIPYHLRGAAPFLDRPEVRAVLHSVGSDPRRLLRDCVGDLRGFAGSVDQPPQALTEAIDALCALASEMLATEDSATWSDFGAWLKASLAGETGPTNPLRSVVELSTFHAAKGLEWPVVFLVGLEAGLVPIAHAGGGLPSDVAEGSAAPGAPAAAAGTALVDPFTTEDPAVAEERRLFYVALTRAERELHLSWAQRRTFAARIRRRRPSPYLRRVEAVIADLAAGGNGQGWSQHLAAARNRIREGSVWPNPSPHLAAGADPDVLAALRSWRAAKAQATGVPAFAVLHDTTLAAVARLQPNAPDELLALPGVGPVKFGRYGSELLALVAGQG
ncbi:MAG: ATP-dependent helicase [Acidimicrobiales bacterium]